MHRAVVNMFLLPVIAFARLSKCDPFVGHRWLTKKAK